MSTSNTREVLHRHLRLPRQPGGLAPPRRGAARARGRASPRRRDADVVIVNTCSVTATADQGARQTIRRIARENPAARDRRDRLLRHAPAGRSRGAAGRRPRRPERRQAAISRRGRRADDGGTVRRRRRTVRRVDRARHRRAGPPSRCACRPAARSAAAYCIIPTTRGAGRSLPLADVVARGRSGSQRPGSRRSR